MTLAFWRVTELLWFLWSIWWMRHLVAHISGAGNGAVTPFANLQTHSPPPAENQTFCLQILLPPVRQGFLRYAAAA
jgi:hypothetical protein